MKYIIIVIFVILISMSFITFAGTGMEKKLESNKDKIAQMSELNNKERLNFLSELGEERSDIQSNLIIQFSNSDSKEMKFAAAFLLGLYRMDESVRYLSKFITLENNEDMDIDIKRPIWGQYPVAEALCRIGIPSVPEMLKNIKTSNDEKVVELSISVIQNVEGSDIGRIILEKEMEKQTDTQNKNKFESAVKKFDELVKRTTSKPDTGEK